MNSISVALGLLRSLGLWRILGILMLLSAAAGCIGREDKLNTELPTQNTTEVAKDVPDESKPNQIYITLRPSELNRSGRLPVLLRITNPRLNETVLTVFKPQYGLEWHNQTNVTYINNSNWTRQFSIRPQANISYIKMFVQISENKTVVKKAAWNITFGGAFR